MSVTYKIESIPKHNNGRINVAEYRERSWHTQQKMVEHLSTLNGTVADHENRMRRVERVFDISKTVGTVVLKGVVIISILLGIIKTISTIT